MKLVKVKVEGYRRFKDPSEMNVDGKLIAIIGPNEAGKTSFLKALLRINDNDPILQSGGAQELTRGIDHDDDVLPIIATYLLEETDRNSIAEIPGCEQARWFFVKKRLEGSFYIQILPYPVRPLKSRQAAVTSLKKALPKVKKYESSTEKTSDASNSIETTINDLSTDENTLSSDLLKRVEATAETLRDSEITANIPMLEGLAERLTGLVEEESVNLHGRAANILFNRRPKFLLFGPDEINLSSEYDVQAVKDAVPTALDNLTRLAGLDVPDLARLVTENDQGQIETVTRQANERLANIFTEAWSQSELEVVFRVSGSTLSILVGEKGLSYVRIAERSEGLRRYVALLAFMWLESSDAQSILLIDEAETHLHYDAQADLVQMLARQNLAAKVIYTTHSIGCLPEDLGSGVRQIEAIPASGYSRIQNWFWEGNSDGFSPLLFGMGAETLAFVPIRYALVAEGAADMLLLPRLFREAANLKYLGFQIVPGLSEADENRIVQLEKASPRTVYIGDSDKAGKGLVEQVKRAGVPPTRVFTLPDGKKEGLVTEDFIDSLVYINAINEELRRSHGDLFHITEADLGRSNKPAALSKWCKAKSIKTPSKRAVAYRVLETEPDKEIISPKKRKALASIVRNVRTVLGISTELK